ncbi:hypothetical protein E2C01_048050 [Portunus trituberculatus]|uniref:Uncharacterized protein n=1 Tax=Portunus trituberculatus TaxID=210409 RepID=A0A5B7GA59_PORTR|nr:hypothetical protein [Portunus trituberculatus]
MVKVVAYACVPHDASGGGFLTYDSSSKGGGAYYCHKGSEGDGSGCVYGYWMVVVVVVVMVATLPTDQWPDGVTGPPLMSCPSTATLLPLVYNILSSLGSTNNSLYCRVMKRCITPATAHSLPIHLCIPLHATPPHTCLSHPHSYPNSFLHSPNYSSFHYATSLSRSNASPTPLSALRPRKRLLHCISRPPHYYTTTTTTTTTITTTAATATATATTAAQFLPPPPHQEQYAV